MKYTFLLILFPVFAMAQITRGSRLVSDTTDAIIISENGQPIYLRTWTSSQFEIYPDDGVPDGKKLQYLIDSAYTLDGLTIFRFDSSGGYCLSDLPDRILSLNRKRVPNPKGQFEFDYKMPFLGWCLGCCEKKNKKPF